MKYNKQSNKNLYNFSMIYYDKISPVLNSLNIIHFCCGWLTTSLVVEFNFFSHWYIKFLICVSEDVYPLLTSTLSSIRTYSNGNQFLRCVEFPKHDNNLFFYLTVQWIWISITAILYATPHIHFLKRIMVRLHRTFTVEHQV